MVRSPYAVVAVFALNVRVVFYVRENVQIPASAGFCERFGDGVDAASLRPPYNPSEIVFFRQSSFLPFSVWSFHRAIRFTRRLILQF